MEHHDGWDDCEECQQMRAVYEADGALIAKLARLDLYRRHKEDAERILRILLADHPDDPAA